MVDFIIDERGDVFQKGKLVCRTFDKKFQVITDQSEIKEKVLKKHPSFDGTYIRAFFAKGSWRLSTLHSIDAFQTVWKSKKSFGQLFEKHKKVEMLDSFLDQDYCYSFLLLDTEAENILPHFNDELFHVNTYDCKKKSFVDEKPIFSTILPSFTSCIGYVDRVDMGKGVQISRPQKGVTYYTDKIIYTQFFDYYIYWKKIVDEKTQEETFWLLMKKKDDLKMVTQFCEYFREEFFEKYKFFNEFVEDCNTEYFEKLERVPFYKEAQAASNTREYLAGLDISELNSILPVYKEFVKENTK